MLGSLSRAALWILGSILALALLIVLASFFVDEPLRRSIERGMNHELVGYKVSLPHAHFQLFGLSVTLQGLTVRQEAHPEPPVAQIPRLRASVQWRELLSLELVADFLFDRPKIYLNLPQVRKEVSDAVPIRERGLQEAALKIYPLKINLLRINDGEITYIDEDPKRPLHISHLNLRANNIRNIHSREHVYPSPLHADAVIFETGRGVLDGHADFLAEPFPGFHTIVKLQGVPLDYFRPMIARSNLSIREGVLDTQGEIEYSAETKVAHLSDLAIRRMRLDYVHTLPTAQAEAARKQQVKQAASKASNKPGVLLKLDRFELADCEIGLVNKARTPAYRVFLADTNLSVTNLSNHFCEGPAHAKLRGRFMGSGTATAEARFRPDLNGADFDLKAEILNTQMPAMNDLFRAYGKFDVVAGLFSFYSELHVKNGQITGYVKPLFRDVKVYDKRQDQEKTAFRKLYEKIVGGLAKLLENRERKEVATKANIEGTVGSAKASTWQVIGRLIENAFFRAILPGFDEFISRRQKK